MNKVDCCTNSNASLSATFSSVVLTDKFAEIILKILEEFQYSGFIEKSVPFIPIVFF